MPDPEVQLEDYALVSLEEARAFLQKDEGEAEQDSVISWLINAASQQIINHTGREFAPKGTIAEERTFAYIGSRHLDLWPYDIREATGVILGTDLAVPVELAPDAWRLRPLPAKGGVYQKLRLPHITNYDGLPTEEFEVKVKGLWGFSTVPDLVKHWCKVTVAIWLRKDVAAFSRTLALDDDRLEVPDGLPSAVIRGLIDYTRKPPVVPR